MTRVYVRQPQRMCCLRRELQQAVVSWCSLLIARSCMREICGFWRWPKTWKLERSKRVLKRKLRATHRERSRVPRKTGDGACRNSGSGTVGVERIGSGGKPEACSLFRAKGDLEESPQGLTTCVLLLYCCCLLYTSPSPRDGLLSRMPSSA